MAEALADRYRMITYDRRGFGRSALHGPPDDAALLLDELAGGRAYPILPEGIDPLSGNATSVGKALRPEYVDSAFNLWLVTQTERFRELSYDYYVRQKTASRVDNGWTIAANVTTDPVTHGDLTSGYWWSEQMKYWYLMFGQVDRFDYASNYLSTEGNVFRGLK